MDDKGNNDALGRGHELVREDAPPGHHEMLHLWYKSYSLHIIVLQGGPVQHGQSDQLHFYSETVGPDWSGHAHLQLEVRTRGVEDANPSRHNRYSDQFSPCIRTCT